MDVERKLDELRGTAEDWLGTADAMVGQNRRGSARWTKQQIKAVRQTGRRIMSVVNRHGQYRPGRKGGVGVGNSTKDRVQDTNGAGVPAASVTMKQQKKKQRGTSANATQPENGAVASPENAQTVS